MRATPHWASARAAPIPAHRQQLHAPLAPHWYHTNTAVHAAPPQWTALAEHRHRTHPHNHKTNGRPTAPAQPHWYLTGKSIAAGDTAPIPRTPPAPHLAVPPRTTPFRYHRRLNHTNTTLVRRQPEGQCPHSHERNGKPGARHRATPVPYRYHTGKSSAPRRILSAQRAGQDHTSTTPFRYPRRSTTPRPNWYGASSRAKARTATKGTASQGRAIAPHQYRTGTTLVSPRPSGASRQLNAPNRTTLAPHHFGTAGAQPHQGQTGTAPARGPKPAQPRKERLARRAPPGHTSTAPVPHW